MVVGAIADQAARLGLRRIVILEHVPDSSDGRRVMHERLPTARRAQLDAIAEEIARFRGESPVQLVLGAEIDADPHRRDGRLLLGDLQGLQVILAATHFLPEAPGYFHEMGELPPERAEEIYYQWMPWLMHVAANPQVDVLAHPGREMLQAGVIADFGGRVRDDFEKLLLVCQRHNTAFELNESLGRYFTAAQLATYEELFAMARDLGVKISLGSDAHRLDQIGQFTWSEKLIKRLGLGPQHYFHPRPRD